MNRVRSGVNRVRSESNGRRCGAASYFGPATAGYTMADDFWELSAVGLWLDVSQWLIGLWRRPCGALSAQSGDC